MWKSQNISPRLPQPHKPRTEQDKAWSSLSKEMLCEFCELWGYTQGKQISCLMILSGDLGNDQETEERNKSWKDAEFQPSVAQYQFPEDSEPKRQGRAGYMLLSS